MDLQDDIQDIREKINSGAIISEASVSQTIVLRLLNRLGWDVYDPNLVCPEFSLEGMRVDYALLNKSGDPQIFIEVKNLGQGQTAERQLFEYVFHQGVPLAIWTDGQEWSFYLPSGFGEYQDRCVYKLDLLERPVKTSEKIFQRYLSFDAVNSGTFIENAKNDYEDINRRRQESKTIPIAFNELIKEKDELLIELIADRVQTICGFIPSENKVAEFLDNFAAINLVRNRKKVRPPTPSGNRVPKRTTVQSRTSRLENIPDTLDQVFRVCDQVWNKGKSFNDALTIVAKELEILSSTVRDKCTRLISIKGKVKVNTMMFNQFLNDRDRLIGHLTDKFPQFEKIIKERLR